MVVQCGNTHTHTDTQTQNHTHARAHTQTVNLHCTASAASLFSELWHETRSQTGTNKVDRYGGHRR
jgi:hypothetical protein